MSKKCAICGENVSFFSGKFISDKYVCNTCYELKEKPIDDKFLIKWKPIHEKGVLTFVASRILIYFIVMIPMLLFLTEPKPSLKHMANFHTICGSVVLGLIYAVALTWIWSTQEKKYKKKSIRK
jgi:hypothetical protein